ncbi:MAG: hypothetical protein AB1730_15150 [Myxococcota bacterium]
MSPPARTLLVLLALSVCACGPQQPPPTRETLTVSGAPYDRGLAHGTQLRSKIRSFYTTLLTNSLFPYLSRERPDIASLLTEYQKERYADGRFAYELLLDSAKSVERTLNRATREELQGIADGSGLSYDQVLVLNTFVDSVLAVRGVALAIRQGRAPVVEAVELVGAGADGVDNDGDGDVDEPGEGVFSPWAPELNAQAVELPPDVKLRAVFVDPDGVDPATVRVTFGTELFTQGSPQLVMTELAADRLEVVATPSQPLTMGAVVTVVLSAGDKKIVDNPPPSHASFMRDEELVFTVKGAGLARQDVRRPRLLDHRTRPPTFALGARGTATAGDGAYLAQHFALLDANTSHKHTVAIRHQPESGPAYVTVGWAGVVYGFTGMNERGVGYACSPSDTLDNSVVGSVLENVADLSQAKLLATGTPIGFVGRKVLEQATDAASARDVMAAAKHVYGWTCLVGDAAGGLEAVEVDSDVFNSGTGGIYPYRPEDVDATGRPYASVGADDLLAGSSYSKNLDDAPVLNIAGTRMVPQRQWSSFFFRSRRAMDGVGRKLKAAYGTVDAATLQGVLGDPELVDRSDSMNAVVLDLGARQVRSAMGQVPATDGPFEVTEVRP